MVKKKVAVVPEPEIRLQDLLSSDGQNVSISSDSVTVEEVKEEKRPIFKDPNFQHAVKAGNKKKTWKSLKQIITQERSLNWVPNSALYGSVGAPPSFKPAKKYSDISGLLAKYTDPQTKLCYSNADEFATTRSLPSDIIAGYLILRGANNPIG